MVTFAAQIFSLSALFHAALFAQDKFHVMAIGSKYDTQYFWLNFRLNWELSLI